MNPDLMNALIAVGSAVISAGAVWFKMRRGGSTPTPPLFPPIGPVSPSKPAPPIPTTGRPGLDLLFRLWMEMQQKREAEREVADARALFVELDNLEAARRKA